MVKSADADIIDSSTFSNTMKNYNYLPLYIVEILRTFTIGTFNTAAVNYLLLDLKMQPVYASIVPAAFFFGFIGGALKWGDLSDKIGARKVIIFGFLISTINALLSLIPPKTIALLTLFAFYRVIDGIVIGMFWPTIQNFTRLAEKEGGSKKRTEFLSRYNFSWNIGFVAAMVLGTGIVYYTGSNYIIFYFNLILCFLGFIYGLIKINDGNFSSVLNQNTKSNSQNKESNKNIKHSDTKNRKEIENMEIKTKKGIITKTDLTKLPIISIIFGLLIHSLTDGAIVILIPLRISILGEASYWVFFLGLVKNFSQTLATTLGSKITDNKIYYSWISMQLSMLLIWGLFIFSSSIWQISMLLILSGATQGTIYVLGMRLMAARAEKLGSAKPFNWFQGTMGSGRMIGPIVSGYANIWSDVGGAYFLIGWDLIVFITTFMFFAKNVFKRKHDLPSY